MARRKPPKNAGKNPKAFSKAVKGIGKATSKTVTSIVAPHYAQKALEVKRGAEVEKLRIKNETERAKLNNEYQLALRQYNSAISGETDDSNAGSSQNKSTTQVGGGGSVLGG